MLCLFPVKLRFSVALSFLVLLAGCGGSGSSSGGLLSGIPDAPENIAISSGDTEVTLSWDSVSDIVYSVCQAEENITDSSICLSYSGGTLYQGITTGSYTVTDLTNGTTYYFVVIATNSDDTESASGSEVSAIVGQVSASITGILNDTGLTTCGDYAFGNSANHDADIDCSGVDDDGDPVPSGQDALYGLDNSDNDDSDGHAGFSFSKLDENGLLLEASSSSWSCVKDNVTGLIWEVKTDDAGLHDKDDTFSWYNTDSTINGGDAGNDDDGDYCSGYDATDSSTFCNTDAFVTRVNAVGLCGANDWRMPTMDELLSLADLSEYEPAIDTDYFPNTSSIMHWSSMPSAFSSGYGWLVDFRAGISDSTDKEYAEYSIRLVRGDGF